MFNMFQAQQPQGPQVIDPRAQYEQQSLLADTMLQNAQQYQGGGALGALAMIANAYGANKMGERAQGSLSSVLEQEEERARQAAAAERSAADKEWERELQKIRIKAGIEAENRAPPAAIQLADDMQLPPGSPERAEFLRSTVGGNAPTVNVNSGPQGPQRDGDFAFVPDPNSPAGMRAAVIPGTETYLEQQRASEGGAAATNESNARSLYDQITSDARSTNINQKVDEVLENISPWTTGFGSILANVPGTPAADLEADLKVLQSDQVLGRMEEMKNQSSTGATGFGAMNKPELELLMSDQQALLQRQSDPEAAKSVELWRTQFNTTNAIDNLTREVEAGNVPMEEATRVAERIRAENQQRRAEIIQKYGGDQGGNQPAQGQRPQQGQGGDAMSEFERRAARYRGGQ